MTWPTSARVRRAEARRLEQERLDRQRAATAASAYRLEVPAAALDHDPDAPSSPYRDDRTAARARALFDPSN